VYTSCIPEAARTISAHFARSAILAAATKVFTQHGIAPTRVEDILLAAGIARRTFYRHFRSKDDVLAALYEVWTGELVKAIEAARARKPDDPLAGVRAGITTYLAFFRASPRALRELVGLAMTEPGLAPRRRWLRGEIVRLLDEAVRALDGRKLDPLVYLALVSALEGLSLEPTEVDRVEMVVNALMENALGLPKPAPLPRAR